MISLSEVLDSISQGKFVVFGRKINPEDLLSPCYIVQRDVETLDVAIAIQIMLTKDEKTPDDDPLGTSLYYVAGGIEKYFTPN